MKAELYPFRREATLSPAAKIALGLIAAGSLFVLHEMDKDQDRREGDMEHCVGEIVGHEVNLVTNPETGALFRPASVFEEVVACQRSDADVDEAKILLED